MTLMKIHPSRNLFRDNYLPKQFAHFMDSFFDESQPDVNFFKPQTDIVEKDGQFELLLSLPGMKKEDIKIDLKDNVLTISGERKLNKEENGKYHRVETYYGSFSRSFTLPENVKKDGIDATFTDGMLSLGAS